MYAYIGAAAVVGLLIGLVVLSVIWVSKTVSRGIQERTLEIITSYDQLLDARGRQLADLDRQIQAEEEERSAAQGQAPVHTGEGSGSAGAALAPSALLGAAERMSTAPYLDGAMGQVYEKIRRNFSLDPQALLEGLPIDPNYRGGGPATAFLSQISYDTVYELSTLPGAEQLAILAETVPDELLDTLDSCRTRRGFNCLAFYDALQARAAQERLPIRLRMNPADITDDWPEWVELIPDPGICEGVQIEADNLLFDYCVKMEEVG